MKSFSGTQYLMIDAATQFGLSKKTFEERIEWTKANLNNLESLLPQAEEKPLYLKAVNAIRDTQAGKSIGHLVGLDSCSSGIQLLSAAMGCRTGALHTGLINPNAMPDAYMTCTSFMKQELGYMVDVPRADAKQALMCFMYGSEAIPKEIFEEGSPAYKAFFKAARDTAPEAYDLRSIMINAWQPFALEHSWTMPDGFNVVLRTMVKTDTVVKVPELNSSFTHVFSENQGTEKGLALSAHLAHSIDSLLIRELNRRCNHNRKELENCLKLLSFDKRPRPSINLVNKTKIISLVSVKSINESNVKHLDVGFITRLEHLIKSVLTNNSFEIICVHDEIKAHANNMNIVRYWYKEFVAELADSHIIQNILRQIYNDPNLTLTRASEDLGDYIRQSNYGLA